ncbi:hypothetical protein GCM10017562_63820 [Streptomyces roseofulvus]
MTGRREPACEATEAALVPLCNEPTGKGTSPQRFGADRVDFAEGRDRIRLRTADGRAEIALAPALLAARSDLPPLTADAGGSVHDLGGTWAAGCRPRAAGGRCLPVAEDRLVRAPADEPGGWGSGRRTGSRPTVTVTSFRASGRGHVSVAAGGAKVAADHAWAEVFAVESVERGEETVGRADAGAGTGGTRLRTRSSRCGVRSPPQYRALASRTRRPRAAPPGAGRALAH